MLQDIIDERDRMIEALQNQRRAETLQLQQIIDAQRIQLAQLIISDWPGLVADLKVAGFYAWAAEAVTNSTTPDKLLDRVAAMKAATDAEDLQAVLSNFRAIALPDPETGYQGFPPTEYAVAWQAVLDSRGIPPQLMSFAPFIPIS